jgi:uncharacterized protein YgiM (DUF1202 family)
MELYMLPETSQVVEDSTLKQLADQYNARYGTSLKVRGKSGLLLPTEMIQAFFKPAISKCLHHVKELLEVSKYAVNGQ